MMRQLTITAIFLTAMLLAWSGCKEATALPDTVGDLTAERVVPDFTIRDSSKIVSYPSGLKIYTHLVGPGPRPEEGSVLRMHYQGRVWGGKVFDDTWSRKKPFSCVLGTSDLIPGMEEALRKLTLGTRAVLIIPPALGYPEKETPPGIPPQSTLIYDVEILGNIE